MGSFGMLGREVLFVERLERVKSLRLERDFAALLSRLARPFLPRFASGLRFASDWLLLPEPFWWSARG